MRRTLSSLLTAGAALALSTIGLTVTPAFAAAAPVNDTGIVDSGGYGYFDVMANDTGYDGSQYISLVNNTDPTVSDDGGYDVAIDLSSTPDFVGTKTISYKLHESGGTVDGTGTLTVVVVDPGQVVVTAGDGQATVHWHNLPAAVDKIEVSWSKNYVYNHNGATITTAGSSGDATVTGLTNGTHYYFFASAFYNGTEDEGITLDGTPRAGVDHPPVAVDDTVSLLSADTKTIYPTQNDTDADDDALSVTGHTTPAHGTVTCYSYQCDYTPAGTPQDDTFDYTVDDGYGGTDTGTVTLLARNVTTNPDSASTYVNESTTVDVLANDTGIIAGDQVDVTSKPGVSAYVDYETQDVVLTGVSQGTFALTYTVSDSDYETLATGTLNVTVGPKRALVARPDEESTDLDVATDIDLGHNDYIKTNGFPLDNTGTKILTQPAHGAATLTFEPESYYDSDTGISTVRNLPVAHYTPATDFLGDDTFTYQLTDAQGRVDTTTVTVHVQVPNTYYLSASPGLGKVDLSWAFSDSPAVDDVMLCYTSGTNRTTIPDPPARPCTAPGETEVTGLPAGVPDHYTVTGLTNDRYYDFAVWVHSHDGTPDGKWSDFADDFARPGVAPVEDLSGDGGPNLLQVTWTNPVAPQQSTGTTVRYSTVSPPLSPSGGDGGTTVGAGVTTATIGSDAAPLATGTYYVSVFSTNAGTRSDAVSTVLKVAPGNNAPVATNDALTVNENTGKSVAVLANDTDADGDALDVKSYTQPLHGYVSCDGSAVDGDPWSCSFYPDTNFYGNDSFTYTVTDHRFGTSTATVNIHVNRVNTAPQASDDSLTATINKATPVDLTQDAYDLENNTLTYTIVTQPTKGTLTCPTPNTGLCSYTGTTLGADSFTWTVTDNGTNPGPLTSNTATESISVVSNQPPTVTDQEVAVNSGASVPVDLSSGASDPDGDTLTYTVTSTPQKGSVSCTGASCTYHASADATGQDSFNFKASDGHGGTATGSVIVDITHVNRPPTTTNGSYSTDNATALVVNMSALATDPDGDPITFSKQSGPTTGSGTVSCSGTTCTYTPAASFVGSSSFVFTASDNHGGSANGTVTVTVTQANRAPVAVDDSATVRQDGSVAVNVAANDTDADADALTFAKASDPAHGTATCTSAGVCTYVAAASYTGADSFTYTVSDGKGGTDTGAVNLSVTANHPPTVGNDSLTVVSGTSGSVNVAANDSDADGDSLTFAKATDPAHGTASCTTAGSCSYVSTAGYVGADSFTYTASDGHGGSTSGTVNVTVSPVPGTATITRVGPASRSVKTKLVVSGKATPARAGSTVQLQRLSGSTWTAVATGTEGSDGSYSIGVKQPTGSFTYRVYIPASGNRAAITTGTVKATFYQVSMPGGSTKAADQFVTVKDTGTVAVALKGWVLTIKSTGAKLTLPAFTLKPGKSVKVHLGKGTSDGQDIYLKSTKKLTAHDTVKLTDLKPVTVASLTF